MKSNKLHDLKVQPLKHYRTLVTKALEYKSQEYKDNRKLLISLLKDKENDIIRRKVLMSNRDYYNKEIIKMDKVLNERSKNA